jgi:DNA-binding NtrC family response regulator
MDKECILIVESDILIRQPLAEYLRECGYVVMESLNPSEARELLSKGDREADIVFAEIEGFDGGGFALSKWIRENHPNVEVILAGTVSKAVEEAGDLCREGPAISKPYDHSFVLDRIRASLAARNRRNKT